MYCMEGTLRRGSSSVSPPVPIFTLWSCACDGALTFLGSARSSNSSTLARVLTLSVPGQRMLHHSPVPPKIPSTGNGRSILRNFKAANDIQPWRQDPATRVDRESRSSPFCDHSRSFLPARIMRHRAEPEIKVSVRKTKSLGYSPCMLCSHTINVRGNSPCPCSAHTYGNPPKAWRLDIIRR